MFHGWFFLAFPENQFIAAEIPHLWGLSILTPQDVGDIIGAAESSAKLCAVQNAIWWKTR